MLPLKQAPPFGLYVHWPFCLSKCPYCDFNSHVRKNIDQEAYKNALLRELEFFAGHTGAQSLKSIFFGGGTPSLMPPDTVAAVIDAAQKNWLFDNDIEITLEANPTSIEREKFVDFKSAGVNRVSIGVQSLIDDDLKALGREHSSKEAIKAIDTAANIFDRYSFDLIYARSHQSLQNWEAELKEALKYADGHMSLYQLTIEPGTVFHTRFQRGDLTIPEDEAAAAFYDLTQDMMHDAGLPAYETSNHAASGQESRHNMIYWQYGHYAGIGPGAHGRIIQDGKRYATRTHRAPEIWRQRVENQNHGCHDWEELSLQDQAEEAVMMSLRLYQGINRTTFENHTGQTLDDYLDGSAVQGLTKAGFMHNDESTLRVTRRGMLCLNTILARILR